MNLYIIGNGFDLMHNLPTRYSDFAEFCMRNHARLYLDIERCFPLLNFGGLWANFEIALGHPNTKYLMECIDSKEKLYANHSIGIDVDELKNAMGEWVYFLNEYIKQFGCVKRFDFGRNDYFITFNYTNVLEEVYNIERSKVYHIHYGDGKKKDGKKYAGHIFGHGENLSNTDVHVQEIGIFIKKLKKEIQYSEITGLLNNISHNDNNQVNNIIVIGHSMATVDIPYFNHIKETFKNANWMIHYYEVNDLIHKINSVSTIGINDEGLAKYSFISDK